MILLQKTVLAKCLVYFQVKCTPKRWRQRRNYFFWLKPNFHEVSKYLFALRHLFGRLKKGSQDERHTAAFFLFFIVIVVIIIIIIITIIIIIIININIIIIFENCKSPWFLRVNDTPLLT